MEKDDLQSNYSLKLNFNENIVSTGPFNIHSSSDNFIHEIVFDRLINPDGNSNLLKQFYYDSLQEAYFFEILEDKKFSDGSHVTSSDIKNLFRYLIRHKFEISYVNTFFSSMKGYSTIKWKREHRKGYDSIPSGFQILSDKLFSIEMNKNTNHIFDILAKPEFTLFKKKGRETIGSNLYRVTNENEDISFVLESVSESSSSIGNIIIQFIKNEDITISEFLKGNLDLLTFNPITSKAVQYYDTLDKLINNPYPEFGIYQSNSSLVQYAIIENVSDSISLSRIVRSFSNISTTIGIHPASGEMMPFNKLKMVLDNNDSSQSEVFVQNKCSYLKNTSFYSYDSAKLTFSDSTVAGNSQIVINELKIDFMEPDNLEQTLIKLNRQLNYSNIDSVCLLLIINHYPDYVISNNTLLGLKNHRKLSQQIPNLYFKEPKNY